MAQPGKKSQNLSILSEIYHGDKFTAKDKFRPIETIRKYFNDPKKVERWLSGAVLFFGVFGIIFGIAHFKNQLKAPFAEYLAKDTNTNTAQEEDPNDLLGLRNKDTDQDGLSNYEEIYVYKTSPYLEDTDSDGMTDSEEVDQGDDPTCYKGKVCFTLDTLETNTNVPISSGLPAGGNMDALTEASQLTADELRNLLLQTGVTKAQLDTLSDAQLLQLYREDLTNTYAQQGTTTQPTANSITVPANIDNMTPEQVRDLLRSAGVGEETLKKISDKDLLNLVKETIAEQQKQ